MGKDPSKRKVPLFVTICHVVAVIFGCMLLYAQDHPESDLYKMFVGAGFHLNINR